MFFGGPEPETVSEVVESINGSVQAFAISPQVLPRRQHGSSRRTFHLGVLVLSGFRMRVIEFIEGPCCWDRQAPARLREHGIRRRFRVEVLLDIPDVLTARIQTFCIRLNAPGMQSTPRCASSGCPPVLAARWREHRTSVRERSGLERHGIPAEHWRALWISSAWTTRSRERSRGCADPFMCSSPPATDFDTSYSDPSLPLSVFVSCPLPAERNRVERLAENIVHEALHLQLSLVERIQPLVIDDSDEELVVSPWKEEWRTVRGLLHAVYVFGNLRSFWKGVAAERPESSSFARARIQTIDSEMARATHLAGDRTLTAAGRRLATSILPC